MSRAKVYRVGQKEFYCKKLCDNLFITVSAKGNLLKGHKNIVVGDEVVLSCSENGARQIIEVLPRKNEIFRILVRESKKKVVASNCDYMVILSSASKPLYKRGLVDRFLVRAAQWGIRPILIFNKMDQYQSDDFDIHFEKERLADLDVPCFEISAKFPEYSKRYLENGIDELKDYIENKTSIFLGHSGVGKSKTISLLSDGEIDLKTQNIAKSGKGAHTTTWSEIIDCKKFQLIDSPGIRSFSLDDISEDQLASFFPDLQTYFEMCKFKNCAHDEKTKGCFFWRDLDLSLDKSKMIFSRLNSYLKILEEVSEKPTWRKKY